MKPSKWKILETWNNYIRVEIYFVCVCTIAFLFTCQCSSTAIPYTKSGYYLWIEEGQNNESDFETRSGPTGQQKSGFGDIWRFILPNKDEFKVQTKTRESGRMNTKSWPWFKFSRSSHYFTIWFPHAGANRGHRNDNIEDIQVTTTLAEATKDGFFQSITHSSPPIGVQHRRLRKKQDILSTTTVVSKKNATAALHL
jgi:hypothetical protein